MELRSRFLMGFPLPLPDGCRECGKRKRKFGRTQPDQSVAPVAVVAIKGPVLAVRARHARRKEAAARWLRAAARFPLTAAAPGAV